MVLMNTRSELVVLCVGRGPSAWGVVNHLLGVKNSEDLRQAHQTVQPQVVEMMTAVGESASCVPLALRVCRGG
jgi:oligopeptidase A